MPQQPQYSLPQTKPFLLLPSCFNLFFFFLILQLRIYRDMGFWICVYWKKWGGSKFFYGDLKNSMLSDWRSRRLFIVWEIKELKASKTSGAGGFFILLKNSTVGSGNRTHGFSNMKPFALLVFVSSDLLNLLKIVRLFACLCWQAVVHVLFFLFYASKNMWELGRNSLKRKIKRLGRIGIAQ